MREILIAWRAWLQAWLASWHRRPSTPTDQGPRDVRILGAQTLYRELTDDELERQRPRRPARVSSGWAGIAARAARRDALRRRFR